MLYSLCDIGLTYHLSPVEYEEKMLLNEIGA